MNILLTTDSYKTSHHKMLPKGCTLMYGNWTPRSLSYAPEGVKKIVSFGQQMVIKWLNEEFQKFFDSPDSVDEIKKELSLHLGIDYDISHFQELHDLGYLPMCFKSLPEGIEVPIKVPIMTWYNTHKDFAWLSLYLETVISNMLWKPMTTATIALAYKRNVNEFVDITDKESQLRDFMIHDFSSRGMSSVQSSMTSGVGFLTSSMGTDNLPAIYASRKYYNEPLDKGVAYSVFASEHSVSSACIGVMGEKEMLEYYMNQYPTGILSIVSDTLDLTKVVRPDKHGYLYQLRDKILSREGTVTIRPDSNPPGLTPVDMICGHDRELTERELEADYPEFYRKGLVECLWDIFGGTINKQGYKVLDSHISSIYGEAINLTNQKEMYQRLLDKGFAATCVILGIGSYTLNMNSRDTLGFAAKGTYCEVDGKGIEIYKDPITDSGMKKSAKGLLAVHIDYDNQGELILSDEVNWEEEKSGELKEIFRDGNLINQTTLTKIRNRIDEL